MAFYAFYNSITVLYNLQRLHHLLRMCFYTWNIRHHLHEKNKKIKRIKCEPLQWLQIVNK